MARETKYKPFKENNKVWLKGSHLKLPYTTMKLAPRRYRPFKIIAKVSRSAVTMPTKNFFPSSLTPTHSSTYPFLYITCKCHLSSITLNCQAQEPHPGLSSDTTLNCQPPNYPPSPDSTHMSLNYNFAQTLHDMPSSLNGGLGHLGHLGHRGQRPDYMPSSCMDSSDPLSHLSHLSHLGYLGLLSHLGYLNVLDPKPIDAPLHTFI
jgi:hypothetical protein